MAVRNDVLIWLAVLALMFPMLGLPPVQRTQEARVLETAREMLGKPLRDWLVPHLNGQVRLEKPPLAYWLSAFAMRIGGVNETTGRVPAIVAGWLTLLVSFSVAVFLFDRRTGWFAAFILLGFMMFARHVRLAETDAYATLFLTLAIYAFLRKQFVLSGAAIGLTILAKGLPALFPVVFVIAWAIDQRDWRTPARWFAVGLPFAILIAVPWYAFIGSELGWRTFWTELAVGVAGEKHMASFIQYFPELLRALLPWTGLTILSIVAAGFRWRANPHTRLLLIWVLSIFIPLCLGGQKQFHYLLPLMPPLAILTAWGLRDVNAGIVLRLTAVALMLIPPAIVLVGHGMRGHVSPIDLIVACGFAAAAVATWYRGAPGLCAGAIVMVTLVQQAWFPSFEAINSREIAAQIRSLDDGPYFFYGENYSVPLIFEMRTIMPRLLTTDALNAAAVANPGMIAVAQTKSDVAPPPAPEHFELIRTIDAREQRFEIYRHRP